MEAKPVCVQDLEDIARHKLSKGQLAYFASGAGEEVTLKENLEAFRRIKLRPRMLRGISEADLSTSILGQPISMPICISPTAFQKVVHPDGELATARAAGEYNTCMTLSLVANTSIQDVADGAPSANMWFALELTENENFVKESIRKSEKAGFKAFVLMCDCPVFGKRFVLERSGFRFPQHLHTPNLGIQGSIRNLSHSEVVKAIGKRVTLTWNHVKWLKSQTKLPIVLKGILTPEDAKLAVEYGADAILVSNHGGRQLDGVPSTIEVLPEIVNAVGGKLEVYVDGGVRLGTDVFKALALGARAVFIGRPVIWGLAYQGESGVKKVLEFLREELKTTMILSGCAKLADITRSHVITSPSPKL